MIIQTTKSFDKQFSKLKQRQRDQFKGRLEIFINTPFAPSLRNHALKGEYLGYRSIDVSGDIRALYTTHGDTIIVFAVIGTHSQLY